MALVRRTAPHGTRQWRPVMWLTIAGLLLLPAVAMQVTSAVAWDRADFAAAAILLIGGGLAIEAASRLVANPLHRALAAVAIVGLVGLIWADAAVGIF